MRAICGLISSFVFTSQPYTVFTGKSMVERVYGASAAISPMYDRGYVRGARDSYGAGS